MVRRGAKPQKRWPAPRGVDRPADRKPASPRSSRVPPLRECADEGPEARGAAERGRGQHVSSPGERGGLRVPERSSNAGLADGGWAGLETARKQVRCLTVTSSGSIDRGRRRTVGSRPHGRIHRPDENAWSGAWVSRVHEARVRPDFVHPRADRTHGLLEKALEGKKGPGEHRPVDRTLARAAVSIRERTLEVSKAPK